MKGWDLKGVIIFMMAFTVCTFLITFMIAAIVLPAGSVTESARQKIYEIITAFVALIGAFVFGVGVGKVSPPPPAKDQVELSLNAAAIKSAETKTMEEKKPATPAPP